MSDAEGFTPDYPTVLRDWADAIEEVPVYWEELVVACAPANLRAAAKEIERLTEDVLFGIERGLMLSRQLNEQAHAHRHRVELLDRDARKYATLLGHVKALAAENERLRDVILDRAAPSLPVAADPKEPQS